MLSEGLIYFVIFLVFAIPVGLIVVFASVAVVFWRRGKPELGLLLAGLATVVLAVLLMPVFWRAQSFLEVVRLGSAGS